MNNKTAPFVGTYAVCDIRLKVQIGRSDTQVRLGVLTPRGCRNFHPVIGYMVIWSGEGMKVALMEVANSWTERTGEAHEKVAVI